MRVSRMMKALQIVEKNRAEVVQVPVPVPGPGQVLVKVSAVATCPQWDLHIYHGKPMFVTQDRVPYPYQAGQPGHEMTGYVADVGPDTTLLPGQRVCAWRDGGHHRPGCYAEYVVMDEAHLIVVPTDLHDSELASLELAMCVAASVLRLRQMTGIRNKRCAVNGLGPAGLIALQMLRAEGCLEVVGIDPLAARRELAIELGASTVYPAGSPLLPLRNASDAAELAIDCVGYPDAVRYMMDHTIEAVALFAVQRHDYSLNHQGLSIIGYPGHTREAAEYALDLIIKGKLQLRPLITREMPFESYAEAVGLLERQEALKICFIP